MKQASNHLLTSLGTAFDKTPDVRDRRKIASASDPHFIPFSADQEKSLTFRNVFPDFAFFPLITVRFTMGKRSIRSLPCRIFLVLLFLVGVCIPDLHAGEQLRIILKEDAGIVSDGVLLKDIADLQGSDRQQLEKLAQTRILESPVFGETAILNRNQVGELLRAAVGPLPGAVFTGAFAVRIRLQGRHITADEVSPILRAQILESTAWKGSEIVIRSIGNLNEIEIPSVHAGFRVSVAEAVLGKRSMLVPLEILQDGKTLRSYWITVEIGLRAEVVTAARRILTGKTIEAEDIVKTFAEIPDIRASYPRSPEEVIGKVMRRGILPGGLLTSESFADPILVKDGDTVRLRLRRQGILLTSLAKAEQNGRLGQFITVRSVDYSTLLKAQVTGRSEVSMQ